MARKYDVQGTQTYLIVALCFAAVGLWHLFDGWFPRESVLKDHPQEVIVYADCLGMVDKIQVEVGADVGVSAPLMVIKPTDRNISDKTVTMLDELSEKAAQKVKRGFVTEIYVEEAEEIKPGRQLVKIKSSGDSYYLYNKTTAVILLIVAMVCAYIHKVAK